MKPDDYCIAGRLRMLSRIITGRYNEAFTAGGVTFAQAGLLMRIFSQPGIRQTALSKQLQIEKSAMSRDVALLRKNGWLTNDLRHGLFLTDKGAVLAKQCHKIWQVLNAEIRDELGTDAVEALTHFSGKLLSTQ